jgi:hypothetical protein
MVNKNHERIDFADQFLLSDHQKALNQMACDNDESTHPNVHYVDN